jgi:hypothetical protein
VTSFTNGTLTVATVNVSASKSTVAVNPTDTTQTPIVFEVTNTGENTESVVVNISESSLPTGLTLESVSGDDPTSSGQFAVIPDNSSATITFTDIDPAETVTATASVSPAVEATADSVSGSVQTTVEREGEVIATAKANVTAQQDVVSEYAGEDGEIDPFDVIEAVSDFRQQQLSPFELLKIIDALRN